MNAVIYNNKGEVEGVLRALDAPGSEGEAESLAEWVLSQHPGRTVLLPGWGEYVLRDGRHTTCSDAAIAAAIKAGCYVHPTRR